MLRSDPLELSALKGQLLDALEDATLWLQTAKTNEARVCASALQETLSKLEKLLAEKAEGRSRPEANKLWNQRISELVSRLTRANEATGAYVGESWLRLLESIRAVAGQKSLVGRARIAQAEASIGWFGQLDRSASEEVRRVIEHFRPKGPSEPPPVFNPIHLGLRTKVAAQAASPTTAGSSSSAPRPFWIDLEARFRELQTLHRGKDPAAWWISTQWNDGNQWTLTRFASSREEGVFESLAERAAQRLGHEDKQTGLFYWLDLLKENSPNYGDLFSHSQREHGTVTNYETAEISRLCEASADYCLKCENDETRHSSPAEPTRSQAHTRKVVVHKRKRKARARRNRHCAIFNPSADYCVIEFRRQKYTLTPLAGKIVKVLHEAHKAGRDGVGAQEIRNQVHCRNVWDAFRKRDGRKLWSQLVGKVANDIYRLKL